MGLHQPTHERLVTIEVSLGVIPDSRVGGSLIRRPFSDEGLDGVQGCLVGRAVHQLAVDRYPHKGGVRPDPLIENADPASVSPEVLQRLVPSTALEALPQRGRDCLPNQLAVACPAVHHTPPVGLGCPRCHRYRHGGGPVREGANYTLVIPVHITDRHMHGMFTSVEQALIPHLPGRRRGQREQAIRVRAVAAEDWDVWQSHNTRASPSRYRIREISYRTARSNAVHLRRRGFLPARRGTRAEGRGPRTRAEGEADDG
jgi:hypothetical protein